MHGVRLVGGCCGTTPEHIRQIRTAVRGMTPASRAAAILAPALDATVEPPVPRDRKSRLANALSRGSFVVAASLLPPRGHDCDAAIARARTLKIRGVDVVHIHDGQPGSGRLSALSLAVLIEQQAGIETVLHYSCRDRNILGMQSDMLGAHAMGLRNVLLVTGAPGQVGGYPDATAVFDVDSIGLTNLVARLNQGFDVGGQAIGAPTAHHIGVEVNPTALNLDYEIRRFEWKVQAGAEFAFTTPVVDVAAFEAFLKRVESTRVPIIATVWPFDSLRHAEFMANEMPEIRVPEPLLARMRRAEGPEAAAAEGTAIAREIAAAIKPMVQGVQLASASGDLERVLAVLDVLA